MCWGFFCSFVFTFARDKDAKPMWDCLQSQRVRLRSSWELLLWQVCLPALLRPQIQSKDTESAAHFNTVSPHLSQAESPVSHSFIMYCEVHRPRAMWAVRSGYWLQRTFETWWRNSHCGQEKGLWRSVSVITMMYFWCVRCDKRHVTKTRDLETANKPLEWWGGGVESILGKVCVITVCAKIVTFL